MGRIRSDYIKLNAQRIYEALGPQVTTDFETNKQLLKKNVEISSVRLRNRLAGYLVTIKRNESRLIMPPRKDKKSRGKRKFVKKQNRKWV